MEWMRAAFLRRARPWLVGVAVAIAWVMSGAWPAQAVVDQGASTPDHWRWLGSIGGGGEDSIALAQSRLGDIAVGDDAGVSWWRGDVRERAVLSSVRDLAFDDQGLLWIATSEGLFSWSRDGRPARRRLQGGEAGNQIGRIAISDSTLLLATAAGAVWSSNGKIFQPLGHSVAAAAITHVAIRPARFDRRKRNASTGYARTAAGIAQAFLYGEGRLSVVRGLESAVGMRVTSVEALTIPLSLSASGDEEEVVDLAIDPEGQRLYLVLEDLIAWRSIEPDSATRANAAGSGWRIERPNLPPGASIRGLGWASGRVWLATDHGLLAGQTIRGPFRRAASPVGTTSCVEIQARDFENVVALCRTGLFTLQPALQPASDLPVVSHDAGGGSKREPTPSKISLRPDPPLAEIRRRALVRAGLTVGRAHKMWDRLRRRAYWPDLELRFDVDLDYDQERDSDQSFISGDTRRLYDRTRDEGRSYHAAIELDWKLGGIVYSLETVDLSRELRQIVTLRDDVADEINQLYFERQAIRESLALAAPSDSSEVARLAWRARELDAGLDAWTGGWISHWRALSPTPPGTPPGHLLEREIESNPTNHPDSQHPD